MSRADALENVPKIDIANEIDNNYNYNDAADIIFHKKILVNSDNHEILKSSGNFEVNSISNMIH